MPEPDKAPKLEQDVEANRALLDPALDNLSTARQFIDAGLFPFEQKLISFYYGFALLTRYRNDKEKRALAKRFFAEAADWSVIAAREQWQRQHKADVSLFANKNVLPTMKQIEEAVTRIRLESLYNLGVVHHLDKEYEDAMRNYSEAERNAANLGVNFLGLQLLAKFGGLAAAIEARRAVSVFSGVDESIREQLRSLKAEVALAAEIIAEQTQDYKEHKKDLAEIPVATPLGVLGKIREWIQGKEPLYAAEDIEKRPRITTDRFVLQRLIDKIDSYL